MRQRNSDKLRDAIKSLDDTIRYSRSLEYQGLDNSFKNVLQAAVVQNFSLTFGVCLKMMTFQLENRFPDRSFEGISKEMLIQLAAQSGIVSDRIRWMEYLDCEYLSQSATIPLRTFEKASDFLVDAKELLSSCAVRAYNERRAA